MRYRALKFWQSHPWRLPVLSLWAWRRTRPVMIPLGWFGKSWNFTTKLKRKWKWWDVAYLDLLRYVFFFYLYIICLTKHNTHFTHLVHNTKHLYYLSNSLHTTDMLPLLLTTHNTQVTHLSHFWLTKLMSLICLTSVSQHSCHSFTVIYNTQYSSASQHTTLIYSSVS